MTEINDYERGDDWDGVERRRLATIETRLVRLEVTLENFSASIAKHIDGHAETIRDLSDELKKQRPQISTLLTTAISAIAVLLVIIGMVGKVAVYDPYEKFLTRFEQAEIRTAERFNSIENRMLNHTNDGHPGIVLRELSLTRDAITNQIKELNKLLDRHDKEDRSTIGEVPQVVR